MPRLSPEELKAARQKKAEQRAEQERQEREAYERASQGITERRQEIERRREEIASQVQVVGQLVTQHAKVVSSTEALYTEIDKLAKKSPREQVSQLTVDMTNLAIQGLKALLGDTHDEYAEQIKPIVSAGDPPETRDVLLLLGQMRAALSRVKTEFEATRARLSRQREEVGVEEHKLDLEQRQLDGNEEDEDEDDAPMSRLLRSYDRR